MMRYALLRPSCHLGGWSLVTFVLYVPTGVQAGCHQQPRFWAHAGKEAISGLSDHLTALGSGNILDQLHHRDGWGMPQGAGGSAPEVGTY